MDFDESDKDTGYDKDALSTASTHTVSRAKLLDYFFRFKILT